MCLAVLIITVGSGVSLVLFVVVIHSGYVFFVSLNSDLFYCKRCVLIKDHWVNWCKWIALRLLWWFGWRSCVLQLDVLSIADELLPIIIILIRARVVMTDGLATASAQVVLTICVREVTGRGLVFRRFWSERRYEEVVASDNVRRGRKRRCSV